MANQQSTFLCLRCGATSPCSYLAALHFVTAHVGADAATTVIEKPECQRCLWDTTEPYYIKVQANGLLVRIAKVGLTEVHIPR